MTALIEETMAKAPRIVLMACGSFSPPTPMHYRMFEIARDHLEMYGKHHIIGGIMSPTNDAYGKTGLAKGEHRLAMLELGLKTSKWIRVSDWEIKQPQWRKTRSVLEYHQNFMNNCINSRLNEEINGNMPSWLPRDLCTSTGRVQLKLLCGADLLESFAVPGLWDEDDQIESIVSNHGLVVISRFGSNAEKFIFESDILTKYMDNITLITNWVPNEVSSSLIRRLLRRGQSVKYLLDDLILDYIQTHGLFECKSKYITSTLTLPAYSPNFIYTNNNNKSNMHAKSTIITPTSDYDNEDDFSGAVDDNDDDDEHEHMDETDYSIKNVMTKFRLDNRSPSVFCCGDSVKEGDAAKKDARKKTSGHIVPGQARQIVTTERGGVVTRTAENAAESGERNPKKLKVSPVAAEYV